jgi:hypothetical protein
MMSSRTGMQYPGLPGEAGPTVAGASLREQVADALERLSRVLLEYSRETLPIEGRSEALLPTEIVRIQDTVRFLGQVAAGWGELPEQAIPEEVPVSAPWSSWRTLTVRFARPTRS